MVFFVFFDQMCTTLLICISNHAFLVCLKYKCHINNKLLINLACSVCTEKYGTSVFLYKPRPTGSVCTKKTSVRHFSVQTSRSVNKKLVFTGMPIMKTFTLFKCRKCHFRGPKYNSFFRGACPLTF